LSYGAVAGISVVALVVAIALLALAAYIYIRKWR
jgi:hypothetical protein